MGCPKTKCFHQNVSLYVQNIQIGSILDEHILFKKNDIKLSDKIFVAKIFPSTKQNIYIKNILIFRNRKSTTEIYLFQNRLFITEI